MRNLTVLVLSLAFIACGSNGSSTVCDPGATQHCFCPSGLEGAQVCEEDGSGWAGCDCLPTDTSTDGDAADGADILPETACGDCDDGNPCTTDTCNTDDMECDHDPLDADGDGFVAITAPDDETFCGGTDCDDTRDDVYPGAAEGCGDADDLDCSGTPDRDDDDDGYVDDRCTDGDDCDDGNPLSYEGAVIGCGAGIDLNCDTIEDQDEDGDGYISLRCFGTDCDDADDSVNPSELEQCDDVDHDCDGDSNELWDDDHDGYGDITCGGTDCNDEEVSIYPGALEELCDTVDNDCDGDAIDGIADNDGDDYIDDYCSEIGGDDCDDDDAAVHPGVTEVDGNCKDDDCDGFGRYNAGCTPSNQTVYTRLQITSAVTIGGLNFQYQGMNASGDCLIDVLCDTCPVAIAIAVGTAAPVVEVISEMNAIITFQPPDYIVETQCRLETNVHVY
jgi:hypothetical protein